MRHSSRARVALLLLLSLPAFSRAQLLHERIDKLIAAGHPGYEKQAAPRSSDAEFLRRVTLDLTGAIPTADEARKFLDDRSSDKREKLIDALLKSPAHARRMTQHFDTMLMERRADSKVPRAAWEDYLRTSFEQNKPYDVLVREVLSADGADAATRARAKFYLDRDGEVNLVTRDVGRVFLGRNLQCAQCHDSPLVDDYKQEHYYGIQAFLTRSAMYPNAKAPTAALGEKADGEVSFTSVFDKAKAQKTTAPKILGSKPIAEPKAEKGKEYKVAPGAATVRPVPSFSRREQLAGAIIDHPSFRRNTANRMWALMMGRGIVHPLDFDHSDNPPSHPELLDLLGDELAKQKYDLRWLLREIALSKTYQISSEVPTNLKEVPADRYLTAILKPLTPEQLAASLGQATGDGVKAATAPVVKMFAGAPGQPEEFQANLDQALFLKHGGAIRNLIAAKPKNLLDRVTKLTDPGAVADELFLSVFTRPATAEEKADVADALKDAPDRAAVLSEVIWAMLASTEFRFNH